MWRCLRDTFSRFSRTLTCYGQTDRNSDTRLHVFYSYLWPPYVIGQAIYIFILWFLLSSSFLSSPNLSGRRSDVYHTSTHGVALVQIYNAGLKRAARDRTQKRGQKIAKKSPSGHHPTTLSDYIFATKACINNRKKKLVKLQYLLYMS